MSKPYYSVKFSSNNCRFEIRINDIPAVKYNLDGMVSSQVPLNQILLASGRQQLSVEVLPRKDEENLSKFSNLNITIQVRNLDADNSVERTILEYSMPAIVDHTPYLKFYDKFEVELPYSLKGWKNSKELKKIDSIESETRSYFEYVHSIFAEKDFDTFKKISESKFSELDKAFYTSQQDSDTEWNEFVDNLNKGEMILANMLSDSETKLEFFGDGKIITLQKLNGEPALRFKNPAEKTQYSIPLLLHKPKGSTTLEVIR